MVIKQILHGPAFLSSLRVLGAAQSLQFLPEQNISVLIKNHIKPPIPLPMNER